MAALTRYSIARRYAYRGYRNWYGRVSEPGKPVRWISLGTKIKAEAEEWLRAAMSGRFVTESRAVSVASAALEFLKGQESAKGHDSATVAAYSQRLGWFTEWADGNGVEYLSDLDFSKASDYSLYLGSAYSAKTHREALRVLCQFVKWASVAYNMESWHPLDLLQAPKLAKRAKEFWTVEELSRILEGASDANTRLFWAFMAYAGLRHSEAVSVTPSDISDGVIRVVGKGDKESFIPVGEALEKEIARNPSWDFSGYSNNCAANRKLQRVLRALGLGGGNLHKFRHSFASNLIRSGANIKAVQQLMRHEDVKITLDTYSHLLQEDVKGAADLL